MDEILGMLDQVSQTKKIVAISIMFGSLFGVFFTGFYFDLFDDKIDFMHKPSTFLFFGFILTGLFGLLYAFQPLKNAFVGTVKIAVMFTAVLLFGKVIRGVF